MTGASAPHAPTPPDAPRVSIVIPCYNHRVFLPEAIESALGQTWPCVEVLVVDDGSSDGSDQVAARYGGVRLRREPHRGLGYARNAGLANCRGDVVIFLDADDRLRPDAAGTAVRVLHDHPAAGMVFGRCQPIDAEGQPVRALVVPPAGDMYIALLRRNHIWSPGMAAWRRDALRTIGGFRTDCDPAADYDLYLRAARQLVVVAHDELVAEYRRHGANMSARPHVMLRATLQVLRGEWRHVQGDRTRTRAWRESVREWRAFYGEQMVEQFRAAIRTRGAWMDAARWAARLARAWPRGVCHHVWRKVRRLRRPG